MDLATILRMARKKASPDEVLELLSQAGIEAEMAQLGAAEACAALADISGLSREPGSAIVRLQGRLKTGQRIFAIVVLPPLTGGEV